MGDDVEETTGDDEPPGADEVAGDGDREADETSERAGGADVDAPDAEDAEGADVEGTEAAEDGEDGEPLDPTGTSLVAKVAIEDGALADDVEDHLRDLVAEREAAQQRAAEAEARVDELESKLKRKQADFQNYKKRAKRRQEEIRERATEDLVERLLSVRDDLVRAVEDDHDDVASLREGVKLTLGEFDRVLDAEDVTEFAPEPGDEVDPQRHEVMLRVESDQPAETVADVHRSGFEMAGSVLRPAQVTVSDGPEEGDAGDGEVGGDGGDEGDEGDGGDDEAGEGNENAASEATDAGEEDGGTAAEADGDADAGTADGDDTGG